MIPVETRLEGMILTAMKVVGRTVVQWRTKVRSSFITKFIMSQDSSIEYEIDKQLKSISGFATFVCNGSLALDKFSAKQMS